MAQFRVEAGESVGSSAPGLGKSTLLNFCPAPEPTRGEVLISGRSISNIGLEIIVPC